MTPNPARLLVILSVSAILAPEAAGLAEESASPAETERYASGRILMKLTPKGAAELEEARKGGEAIRLDEMVSSPLRELSQQYGAREWRPLFPGREGDRGAAGPGGMERIYVATLDLDADIPAVCRGFSALSEWVEYAEPDSLVRIQKEGL